MQDAAENSEESTVRELCVRIQAPLRLGEAALIAVQKPDDVEDEEFKYDLTFMPKQNCAVKNLLKYENIWVWKMNMKEQCN